MVVEPQERICILIADEYALAREALSLWLMRVLPDATVLQVASSEEKLTGRVDCLSLILFTLRQPYANGSAMLQVLRGRFPDTPVVLIVAVLDAQVLTLARAHGVSGLSRKTDSPEELLEVMRLALEGKPSFPLTHSPTGLYGTSKLSPRQAEVLELLCEGKSNKEIAAMLNMSGNTVRTHVSAIFNILGVRNRTEAVIVGRRLV